MNKPRITVFCASSGKVDAKYFDATEALGTALLRHNYTLVYGGGSKGLMGCVANTVMAGGGTVIGYIPRFMMDVEWGKKDITQLIEVEDMRERKRRLIEDVDAVVALPGGCGTLEELAEVITLKRLGKFTKPIVILNQDGFYNDLIALFEKMISENFLRPEHRNIWCAVSHVDEIIPAIQNAQPWSNNAIHTAAV